MKFLKQIFSNNVKPALSDEAGVIDVPEAVDPRKVGYADAMRAGWYQRESGQLLSGFSISGEDTVLDVGCGEGLATLFCASQGAHVVFTDIEEHKVQAVQEKANRSKARKVEAYVSDSSPLPVPDNYATKVLSMEVLEHTEFPEKIMAELVRVGKPGAQYLITVPDESSEQLQKSYADPSYFTKPNHIQIFDKSAFHKLVLDAGLEVETYTSWGFYWTMWMSIFWCLPQQAEGEETLGLVAPPFHPALQHWAQAWDELMKLPKGRQMMEAFDRTLPKAQAIIARKPL